MPRRIKIARLGIRLQYNAPYGYSSVATGIEDKDRYKQQKKKELTQPTISSLLNTGPALLTLSPADFHWPQSCRRRRGDPEESTI